MRTTTLAATVALLGATTADAATAKLTLQGASTEISLEYTDGGGLIVPGYAKTSDVATQIAELRADLNAINAT